MPGLSQRPDGLVRTHADGGRALAMGPAIMAAQAQLSHGRSSRRRRSAKIFKPGFRSTSSAQQIGNGDRFASLELGCEEGIQGGNCDNGYSCAYSNSISWRTPSTPNPPESPPAAVFERLFGREIESDPVAAPETSDISRASSIRCWKMRKRLQTSLGAPTAASWMSISMRSAISRHASRRPESESARRAAMDNRPSPSVPEHYAEHSRLMFDLMTRVPDGHDARRLRS